MSEVCEVCGYGVRNTAHVMTKKHLHNLIKKMDMCKYTTDYRDYPFYFDELGKKYSTKKEKE